MLGQMSPVDDDLWQEFSLAEGDPYAIIYRKLPRILRLNN